MTTDATDKTLLVALDKKDQQRASTDQALQPWQEGMSRYASIPLAKAAEAAAVVGGFSGSWAGQYQIGSGVRSHVASLGPVTTLNKRSMLGQPGVPEINFVPFDHFTNRFASKGPSLLGHPISFEVVGPTLKTGLHDWQWIVTDGGAGSDTLRFDSVGTGSTLGSPVASAVAPLNVTNVYGSATLDQDSGGLYVMISQTGGPGSVDLNGVPTAGGLSDGFIGDDDATRTALVPVDQFSKYEIFRVVDVNANGFDLDSSKKLTSFFTFPGGGTACVRAITLIRPKVTRLVAVPNTDVIGRERVFAVLPPETGATSDMLPPHLDWTTDGTRFSTWDTTTAETGNTADFTAGPLLPIPKPLSKGVAYVQGSAGGDQAAPVVLSIGRFRIIPDATPDTVNDVNRIIHIYDVEALNDGRLNDPTGGDLDPNRASLNSLTGWFQVLAVGAGPDFYNLRRIEEVNPETGEVFYAPSDSMALDPACASGDRIRLRYTLHDPLNKFYSGATRANRDELESARLTNLINPDWSERTIKNTIAGEGVSGARADRAVFDTSSSSNGGDGTNSDPGSLMDLGFRMVLYPARAASVGGAPVPDWDNPITSRDVVLDPSNTTDRQTIDIDYSAGLITLSHAPVPGAGCEVAPDGIISIVGDNDAGAVVLFAACVPYSMEEGQLGGGVRVTGTTVPNPDSCLDPNTNHATRDVFGRRTMFALANQSISPTAGGAGDFIDLTVEDTEGLLPSSGFVDIVLGTREDGTPFSTMGAAPVAIKRTATFGYTHKTVEAGPITRLNGVYGGGEYVGAPVVINTVSNPGLAVLRRDVTTPCDDDGVPGTDYVYDTTRGFASRSSAVRFKHANVFKELDGSTTVEMGEPLAQQHQELFNDLFSSWVLSGGAVSTAGGLIADVAAVEILLRGVRVVLSAGSITVPDAQTNYIYLDDSTLSPGGCPTLALSNTLELPDPEHDVLLARVVSAGGVITVISQLQHPLTDLDRRVDILVGFQENSVYQPHFITLEEAVNYVNEISNPAFFAPTSNIGRFFRIRVVGRTQETDGNMPIVVQTDGLMIEGVNSRIDANGVGENRISIEWGGDQCLLDFNGHDDCVVRNVSFLYAGGSAAAPATVLRSVFTNLNDSTQVDRLVLDHCNVEVVDGVADDLSLQCFLEAEDGAFGFCTITNNSATGLRDGAILDGGRWVLFSTIENNVFSGTTTRDKKGGILLTHATSTHNTIHKNDIQSVLIGIVADGSHNTITNNLIGSTEQEGIQFGGPHTTIRSNNLTNIHVAFALARQGIVGTALAVDSVVVDNDVELNAATAGTFPGDLGSQGIVVVDDVVVAWNTTDDGGITAGDNCEVRGNHITGAVSVGIRTLLDGNHISDFVLATGAFGRLRGNTIANQLRCSGGDVWVSDNELNGQIEIGNNDRLIDNKLSTENIIRLSTIAAPLDDVTIRGNQGILNFTAELEDSDFSGNHCSGAVDLVEAAAGNGDNHVVANTVGGDMTTGAASTVTGNTTVGALTVGANCTVTGNKGTTLICNSAGSTFSGNNLSGNLTLGSGAVGGVLTGNKVAGIRTDHTNTVIVGNDVGVSGIDNQTVPSTPAAGTVCALNLVDSPGTIFGAAPTAGNHVQDNHERA